MAAPGSAARARDREELVGLFREEASEHVGTLNNGLLALERGGDPRGLLEALFRSAHSVKGSARMLGFDGVEAEARALEDALTELRAAPDAVSDRVDHLLATVDRLAAAIRTACRRPDTAAAAAAQTPAAAREVFRSASVPTHPLPDARAIRVATGQLDRILGEVAQLTIEKAAARQRLADLGAVALLAERAYTATPSESLRSIVARLRQLEAALEWQETFIGQALESLEADVLGARMLPFASGLEALPRVARDHARQSGKKVALVIEGGEHVLDRQVLELVHEPLIHLVRNAVDHGIEQPDERVAHGKTEQGTVTVEARVHGGRLTVCVSDDGRGVDADTVRAAARRRGLRDADALAALSEDELLELLFEPGFSTRDAVDDFSGRGIGLDIVRTNLERIAGTVTLTSRPGAGTSVRLTVPLSLVTTPALVLRVADAAVAVPLSVVAAVGERADADLREDGGRATVAHGPGRVPFVSLAALLGAPGTACASGPYVVLESGSLRAALGVDRIVGEQDLVVQEPDPHLAGTPFLTGLALLPSGDICALLHAGELLRAPHRDARPAPAGLAAARDTDAPESARR